MAEWSEVRVPGVRGTICAGSNPVDIIIYFLFLSLSSSVKSSKSSM